MTSISGLPMATHYYMEDEGCEREASQSRNLSQSGLESELDSMKSNAVSADQHCCGDTFPACTHRPSPRSVSQKQVLTFGGAARVADTGAV